MTLLPGFPFPPSPIKLSSSPLVVVDVETSPWQPLTKQKPLEGVVALTTLRDEWLNTYTPETEGAQSVSLSIEKWEIGQGDIAVRTLFFLSTRSLGCLEQAAWNNSSQAGRRPLTL